MYTGGNQLALEIGFEIPQNGQERGECLNKTPELNVRRKPQLVLSLSLSSLDLT